MRRQLHPLRVEHRTGRPPFPLLERAMRRHLLWAEEHRALGELDDARDVFADAKAIHGELCLGPGRPLRRG